MSVKMSSYKFLTSFSRIFMHLIMTMRISYHKKENVTVKWRLQVRLEFIEGLRFGKIFCGEGQGLLRESNLIHVSP